MARQTSVIRLHIREFQGATAPSSMLSVGSGTSVARSTVRTVPVPLQVRQAPWLLNGARTVAPQVGQISGFSAATARLGGR